MNENKLIISGHHIELTEALKSFVQEKAEKLFRHEPRIVRFRVELDFDRTKNNESLFIARGLIEIGGPNLAATETTGDMYKSIDGMVHKLDRMLRNRARQKRHKRDRPHGVDLEASLPKTKANG